MTWTYSGDPSDSDKDAVRFLVGDTDTTDQLISDEEIAYLLVVHNGPGMAAVGAARAIAAHFSRLVNQSRSVGDLSLAESLDQKATAFHHLADHLNSLATSIQTPPIANAAASALGAEFKINLLDKFEL